ncbi:HpcH/HpaI aldolase/citrate lyase family protein [Plantibacter sp. Mn2098]|uniref:HpcH/HpaI aldolase/citrate lyase family protein n=1 Tax=Plantibacter sp. Mn2098 TaxID=3395266 RepID=UPI003BE5950A
MTESWLGEAARFDLGPSLLFCPADRPERFRKAADRADAVILDLEDAVGPDAKDAARNAVLDHPLDPASTVVRINAADTSAFDDDLRMLAQSDYRFVMLAKAERPEQIDAILTGVRGHAGDPGRDVRVIALCETATGVFTAGALAAHPDAVALMWGAEDLVASLGGTSSRFADGRYRDIAAHARSTVLLAAGAHGIAAIDAVHLAIDDVAGLQAEAEDASASGFAASACIHPSQVQTIRAAYRPSAEALAEAVGVLDAARAQPGVFRHNGRMIDEPVLVHARRVVARSGT